MKKNLIFIFLPILICFQGCTLQDESEFSGEVTSVVAIEFLPGAISQAAYNQSALKGRISGIIMQYFSLASSRVSLSPYHNAPSAFDNAWVNGFYGGSLASANEMKALAIDEGDQNIQAISLILLANEFSSLTNTFGDIPFTEALQGANNLNPKYERQEDIYSGIINMLDEADGLISSTGPVSALAQSDLIYGGDMQAWKRLAKALKARCLLNQLNKVSGTEQEILSLIEESYTEKNQQAIYSFTEQKSNPLAKFGDTRPGTIFLDENFVNTLITTDDPRFNKYAVSDFPDWQFFGDPELTWSQFSSQIPILSYTELMFMKAEMLLKTGNFSDVVEVALEEAIRSSLDDNNVVINASGEAYIENATDLSGLDQESALQKIIEQAYVSYYGNNFLQSWNNYRRTGYPQLESTEDLSNPNNPSNIVPRRVQYPQNEFDYNEVNLQEAITRQGGALLDNDIWVFGN